MVLAKSSISKFFFFSIFRVNEAVFRSFPKKAIPRGIGCCLGSYAMDSLEGSLGENNKWRPYYKKKLKANDFVTTTLDPINGTIEYWVNGVR